MTYALRLSVPLSLVASLAVLVLAACSAPTKGSDGRPYELEGIVYAGWRNGNPSEGPTGPVKGAVVSTSLDETTATTDANGHFDLITHTPVKAAGCTLLTVTITAAGHPTYSHTGSGNSSQGLNQMFVLSTGDPRFVSGGVCPGM